MQHSLKQISLLVLVVHSLYLSASATQEVRNGNITANLIQQVFKNLIEFTRFYSSTNELSVTYSKTYMPPMISRRSRPFKMARYFILYTHTNELCPEQLDECWCGFADDASDFQIDISKRKLVILKMCSSNAEWKKTKSQITENDFSSFQTVVSSNGTTYELSDNFIEKIIENAQKSRKNSTELSDDNLKKWKSLKLNQHDESLCPYRFAWCWCGYVGNIKDYAAGKKSTEIVETPRIMIDCQPFQNRPYETRNCTIQTGDSLPLHQKLAGSKVYFPCGHY